MNSSIITTKGQIVIPKKIIDKYNLGPGTKLIFKETELGLMLQPLDDLFIKSLKGIGKSTDQRPMSIWWAEYKKEEREIEERKLNLHEPEVKYKAVLKTAGKKKK